ncbi:hypothetical protein GCM10010121_095990 [Streptomyces brasiliensis]|uniref:Uncharacterized protein n=1 Tax=Streptomyces brasiliensis TaxID=1954 RepID=A0A917PBW3_9ACTN|nr:hypothetical protein GCM10010121_095990 [Streptomyces brasiliensis]
MWGAGRAPVNSSPFVPGAQTMTPSRCAAGLNGGLPSQKFSERMTGRIYLLKDPPWTRIS